MPNFLKVLMITIILASSLTPLSVKAQDDDSSDNPSIVPPIQGSSVPPVIIDETDSGGVSDVDSYED